MRVVCFFLKPAAVVFVEVEKDRLEDSVLTFFIFTEINQQQQQQQLQQLQQLQQQVEILKLMIVWKRPDVKVFLLQFNGLARFDNKLDDETKRKKT